ncbi:hypothetical protein L3X07_07400 [Levilactobacillus brevis]|nr:hypothetical protein [Levilactobacillus brevis]
MRNSCFGCWIRIGFCYDRECADFGTTANGGSTTAKTTLEASDTTAGDKGVVLKSAPTSTLERLSWMVVQLTVRR